MWEMLTFETLYNGQSTLSTQLIIYNYSVLATLFRVWGGGGEEGDMESVQLILFVTTKAIYILRLISLSHKICTLMMRSHLYLTLRTHHHKILLARHCVDNTKGLGFRPGLVIVLCSWSRHSPITVSLSTQEYKWVPVNCQGA